MNIRTSTSRTSY